MGQNEQIEDNSFKNFEEQGKYICKNDYYEKRAIFYARIAQIVLGVTIVSFISGGYIMILINKRMQIIEMGIIICTFVLLYLLSLVFAILAYHNKKTEITKRTLQAEWIIPVCVVGGVLLLLYVIWGSFGIFASGKTTFIEYLMWLFS